MSCVSHHRACDCREAKFSQLEQSLNDRNEATKVWIQADRQTRAYACQLERENEKLRQALEVVCGRYESVGDNESRKQGVSLGVYTVCKRALQAADPNAEHAKENKKYRKWIIYD